MEDVYGIYSQNDHIETSDAYIKRAASSEPLRAKLAITMNSLLFRSATFGSCPALAGQRSSLASLPNRKKTVVFVA